MKRLNRNISVGLPILHTRNERSKGENMATKIFVNLPVKDLNRKASVGTPMAITEASSALLPKVSFLKQPGR
jgi:hypothetical protein